MTNIGFLGSMDAVARISSSPKDATMKTALRSFITAALVVALIGVALLPAGAAQPEPENLAPKAKVSAIGPRWWLRCAASVEAASVEVSVEAAAAIGLSLLPSLLSAVAAVAAGAALARAFAAEVALQLASSRPTLLHASALPPCHAATPRSALSKQMSVRCGPSHRCCCRCLG